MLKVITVKLITVALLLLSGNIASDEADKSKTDDKSTDIWSSPQSLEKGYYLQLISSSNEGRIEQIGQSLSAAFSENNVIYVKEGKATKLLLGAYLSRNKAEVAKKQLIAQYPGYKNAFIREINKESSHWIAMLAQHMNRCWTKPEKTSSAWSASVSLKISKDLYLHSKKINHCDGSVEYCRSVDNAVDRCIGRKLPKPSNAEVFETDITLKFGG